MTIDGATWQRVLDTGAIAGLPTNSLFDQWSTPWDPSLYVGLAGRGILKISELGLGGGVILRTAAPTPKRSLGRWNGRRPGSVSLMAGWAPGRPVLTGASSSALDNQRSILVDAGEVTVLDASHLSQ